MMKNVRKSGFDSRCKIILLILTVLTSTMAPTLSFVWGLMLIIGIFGLFSLKYKMVVLHILIFGILCLIRELSLSMEPYGGQTMILAWMGLMFQVFPCAFMAAIILATTKINEFLTAMTKAHIPKKLTIPMSVMLRYMPTIGEDWRFIKDAMRLRGISPTFLGFWKNPMLFVECLYSPLLMAASRTADELTMACVTRGIEEPRRRSCLIEVHLHVKDYVALIVFLFYFLYMKFGGVK